MTNCYKPKGLFLNQEKACCSIYESGKMVFDALQLGGDYELDYLEISINNRTVPGYYDFYLFNYHHITMAWLDLKSLNMLPGLKITLVLEVAPNDPFVLCPSDIFDAYCAIDPTMLHSDKRVYSFPRPLETLPDIPPYIEKDVPVIGSFGFATPGKGFELVVDAVNKEFDKAVIRINIPPATYADDVFWKLHKQNYAHYLADLCHKTAKKGIEVIVTHEYMTKEELIRWCGQNTLNCFFYNRNQTGLSATTDQAISSGRPLAISENNTFRHIAHYIESYPSRTLIESIYKSQNEVIEIQQDWSPIQFCNKFTKLLSSLSIYPIRMNSLNLVELKPRKTLQIRREKIYAFNKKIINFFN